MTEIEYGQWWEIVSSLLRDPQRPAQSIPHGLALLSADTDQTQSFVFQSPRLPEIRGASMRLDELNREGLPHLLQQEGLPARSFTDQEQPGCIIFAGGGSLLAVVPQTIAKKLVKKIEKLYPQKTGAATITAVAHPVSIDDLRGTAVSAAVDEALAARLDAGNRRGLRKSLALPPFQRLMRRQALALRQKKQARRHVPYYETIPFARTCNSCGRRPAADALAGIPGEAPHHLCVVCAENGKQGSGAHKGFWHKEFERWCSWKKGKDVEAKHPQDLHEIGAASKRYIGYIYADGNGIGGWLQKTEGLPAYSERSQRLLEATETAVYASIYDHLYEDGQTAPFEILTIGGDDLLLIVPADKALPLARAICGRFHEALADRHPDAPTMSAGVVIAQESNPISFVHELAYQLLKSAKRRTKQLSKANGETPQSRGDAACIDYMILKSQSTLASRLRDVRQSAFLQVEHEQEKERVFLTARPYTLPEIDRLLAGAKKLKGFNLAPGQLHQMRREFQNGRFPAIFYYLYQRTRLGRLNEKHAAALAAIEAEWQMVEPHGAAPWRYLPDARDGYREYDTPLIDMLGLFDFVQPAENDE